MEELTGNVDLSKLDKRTLAELYALVEEKNVRDQCVFYNIFPKEDRQVAGQMYFSRDKYPKHMEFFAAGSAYLIRVFLAGNRVGKTLAGAEELIVHMTGLYPEGWKGRRFDKPVRCWAAGTTAQKTMEIIQGTLFGEKTNPNRCVIPKHLLVDSTPKHGTPGAINDFYVQHASGGVSSCVLKDYKQGRAAFEGKEVDVIWLDEECTIEIFDECKTRVTNTSGIVGALNGLLYITFTPMQGMTALIQYLMTEEKRSTNIKVIHATWDDIPHLTQATKDEMMASWSPAMRDARMRGIPFMGTGQIFPIPSQDVFLKTEDFPRIQPHWLVAYGLDEGLTCTAAVWGALDPDTDVLYIYDEYVGRHQHSAINARAIKIRGNMTGAVDTSAMRSSPTEGVQVIQTYLDEGLELVLANKAIVPSISMIWERLNTGRLKFSANLLNLRSEYEVYHYDEDGKPEKTNIHLMDALRYLLMTGMAYAIPYATSRRDPRDLVQPRQNTYQNDPKTRNQITGY